MRKGLLATSGGSIVLALSVTACGGGGGGSSARPQPTPAPITNPTPTPTPPPAPTPPPGTDYNTVEYQRSNGAAAAGAITAYNSGATGKGVKIAVIDTGINPGLSEFAGKIDAASRDVAGSRPLADEDGHGTAVSAVAAAARDGVNMHGVAFDAMIVALRTDDPGSCGSNDGCAFYDDSIARGIDAARLAGARVVNMSLGGSRPSAEVLSAMQRAVSAGMVIVISAGNDGDKSIGDNADPYALVPAQTFPGSVIIAGSVGVDNGLGGTDLNRLSNFSNKAGNGASYYLAALGYSVRAPGEDGRTFLWSGTSFSAPVISGAVALMAQAFPNLSAQQIVQILFDTADDLGATGTDSIYGHGRLNLNRAFQPSGTTSLAGTSVTVDLASNGEAPAAAGDATDANGPLGAIILDSYSRAFAVDLAATLQKAEQARPLARALRGNVRVAGAAAGPISIAMTVSERRDLPEGYALERLGIGPDDARKSRLVAGAAVARLDSKTSAAFGFSEGAKSLERRLSGAEAGAFLIARDIAGEPGFDAKRDNSVALRRDLGLASVTFSAETGSVWREVRTSASESPYRWTSVALDRDFGRTWLSAGVSRLEEKDTLLGGRMGNSLGGGGSSSLFVDAEARRDFGSGITASIAARRGWTEFAGGKFQTGAYSFDLAKVGLFGSDDRIGLRLAQPLRVESGGFAMMLPTAYDYATGVTTDSLTTFSLTPSGRELDAELSYGTALFGGDAWLGGNLFMRRQPGHVASADEDYGAAVRFALNF